MEVCSHVRTSSVRCGNSPQSLPPIPMKFLLFIERHRLFGAGIGYTDAHLLAAVALTPGTLLWTRDKRLQAAAARLSCMASLP